MTETDQNLAREVYEETDAGTPGFPPWYELSALERSLYTDLGYQKAQLAEMFLICSNLVARIEALETARDSDVTKG